MTVPIPVATTTAALEARLSSKRLIDITNQDVNTATSINATVFNAAVEDSEELFQSLTGGKSNTDYNHDLGAIRNLTLYFLYSYTGDPEYTGFYLELAQQFLEEALMKRLNITVLTPANQRTQEFTLRQQMIQSIPRPL